MNFSTKHSHNNADIMEVQSKNGTIEHTLLSTIIFSLMQGGSQ